MSRQIDQERVDSGDLNEDEILYLQQRDMLPKGVEPIDEQLHVPYDLSNQPHTGDANTAGLTIEDLEEELERRRAAQAEEDERLAAEAEGGGGEDDDEDYSSWTNDDLRAEIARRNADRDEESKLSLEGRKADLIATLEADDAESEEE